MIQIEICFEMMKFQAQYNPVGSSLLSILNIILYEFIIKFKNKILPVKHTVIFEFAYWIFEDSSFARVSTRESEKRKHKIFG